MILDSMRSFQRYSGLNREVWAKISDFLSGISGTVPEASSTQLDGDRLIANVVHTETKAPELGKYELHRRYIDIHLPLRGSETIICRCDSCDLKQIGSFDEANDYVLFEPAPGLPVYLEPGYFLRLYPGEAHHVLTGDGSQIVKVIIKIDIELFSGK